jgi:hypothetical protein
VRKREEETGICPVPEILRIKKKTNTICTRTAPKSYRITEPVAARPTPFRSGLVAVTNPFHPPHPPPPHTPSIRPSSSQRPKASMQ